MMSSNKKPHGCSTVQCASLCIQGKKSKCQQGCQDNLMREKHFSNNGARITGYTQARMNVDSILMHACLLSCFSCAQLCVTPWIVALQPPLSKGFSRQGNWSGLPFPCPGDLCNSGIEPTHLLCLPALAGGFFTTNAIWKIT